MQIVNEKAEADGKLFSSVRALVGMQGGDGWVYPKAYYD
jgi:hypothetical protein